MTSSKGSNVTQEIVAYFETIYGDYMHYCELFSKELGKESAWEFIYSNGQSEYSKHAITRAVNYMDSKPGFFSQVTIKPVIVKKATEKLPEIKESNDLEFYIRILTIVAFTCAFTAVVISLLLQFMQ